jgi:subtilisin family serine protease
MAAIAGSAISSSNENGDIMASFSSRGPDYPVSDVIKPDVSAPGVDILAAGGTLGEVTWYCWSGTSMASPHAAGSAALLKALHPDWSPAEIQSALMTTANTSVLKEDKSTPATPFDTGAGRIDVSRAARAGFVMDENYVNYMTANPSLAPLSLLYLGTASNWSRLPQMSVEHH